MHMDMIFADHSFEYLDIFCVTDLNDEFSASFLYITFEYLVSVLCDPYNMSLQLTDGMTVSSHMDILTHL